MMPRRDLPPSSAYALCGVFLGAVVGLALLSSSDHTANAARAARRPPEARCPRDLAFIGYYTEQRGATRADMMICAKSRKGATPPSPAPHYASEAAALAGAAAAGYEVPSAAHRREHTRGGGHAGSRSSHAMSSHAYHAPAAAPRAPAPPRRTFWRAAPHVSSPAAHAPGSVPTPTPTPRQHAGLDPWIPDPSVTVAPRHYRSLVAAHGQAVHVCDMACARRAHGGRAPDASIDLPERGSAPLMIYSSDIVLNSWREVAQHPNTAPEIRIRAAYCRNVPVGPITFDNRGRTWFADPVWGRQQFRFC